MICRPTTLLKYAIIPAFVLGLLQSPLSARSYISLGGGYTTFAQNFESSFDLSGKAGIITQDGLGVEASVGYIQAHGETTAIPDLKMVPITAGINYYLNPRRKISPYAGVLASATLLGKAFDSPAIAFGGKAGINFRVDPQTSVYGELVYLTATDDKTSLELSPIMVNVGYTINFGVQKGEKKLNKHQRGKLQHKSRIRKHKKRAKRRRLGL
ncbi:MAG: hypothetical protein ACI9BD_000781 [Candidatus Marinamargulisbacteria bacterium]|jgi:hypothetical protein